MVKLNRITQEEFAAQERKRDIFLKTKGYAIIRIISQNDFIPGDGTLLRMISEAKTYIKTGHSWINYDIDRKKVKCIQFYKDYDFGILRKIAHN